MREGENTAQTPGKSTGLYPFFFCLKIAGKPTKQFTRNNESMWNGLKI